MISRLPGVDLVESVDRRMPFDLSRSRDLRRHVLENFRTRAATHTHAVRYSLLKSGGIFERWSELEAMTEASREVTVFEQLRRSLWRSEYETDFTHRFTPDSRFILANGICDVRVIAKGRHRRGRVRDLSPRRATSEFRSYRRSNRSKSLIETLEWYATSVVSRFRGGGGQRTFDHATEAVLSNGPMCSSRSLFGSEPVGTSQPRHSRRGRRGRALIDERAPDLAGREGASDVLSERSCGWVPSCSTKLDGAAYRTGRPTVSEPERAVDYRTASCLPGSLSFRSPSTNAWFRRSLCCGGG